MAKQTPNLFRVCCSANFLLEYYVIGIDSFSYINFHDNKIWIPLKTNDWI